MFVDADDLLAKDAIQNLMSYAYANNLDVVEGNYLNLINGKTYKDTEFHTDSIVDDPVADITGYSCMKIFKTELFRKIQFPENYWYEDSIMSFLIFPLSGICGTIKEVIYYYRRHAGSITQTSKGKVKCIDSYYVTELMYDCMEELQIDPLPLQNLFLGHVKLSGGRTVFLDKEVRKATFICFCDLYKRIYGDAGECRPEFADIQSCLKNRDFGKFDLLCKFS